MSTGMEIQLADVRKHEAILVAQQEKLDKWCSGGEVRGEALIRYALAEMSTNDDLRQCTPTSIYLALLACGVTGLVPGKLRGYSFLVPFGNTRKDGDREYKVQEATFMMGWKGVKHIGFRSGLRMISAVIHENDIFDFDKGTNAFVKYREALKGQGPMIGAAAWCDLPRGGLELEFLNMETLAKIKTAATRIRKSPAWDGPFADQMQRKSALKRLGKQVEMGEEFLKADAIEIAQDQHGDASRALDEFTDGSATKFLKQQTTEAATFGHLPRPTQVQVPASQMPAVAANAPTQTGAAKLEAATDKARAADKKREANRPTSPTSAATTAGLTGPPASAATPAASSPAASTTTPTPPASEPAAAASSASAPPSPSPQPQGEANVDDASEPTDGDTSFNTSFFGDEQNEDPVDQERVGSEPASRGEWVAAFQRWSEAHNSKAAAVADWATFRRIFEAWLAVCANKNELEEHKALFTGWSKGIFTVGKRADPAKGIAAVPPDEQIVEMQDKFSRRHKEVP